MATKRRRNELDDLVQDIHERGDSGDKVLPKRRVLRSYTKRFTAIETDDGIHGCEMIEEKDTDSLEEIGVRVENQKRHRLEDEYRADSIGKELDSDTEPSKKQDEITLNQKEKSTDVMRNEKEKIDASALNTDGVSLSDSLVMDSSGSSAYSQHSWSDEAEDEDMLMAMMMNDPRDFSSCIEYLFDRDSDRSGIEEDDAATAQANIYRRIRRVKRGVTYVYEALIPSEPFRSSEIKEVVPFGASFKTAIEAATAADLALVAMWGRFAAAPHLNFSIDRLGEREDVHCRYGTELASYLIEISQSYRHSKKAVRRGRYKNSRATNFGKRGGKQNGALDEDNSDSILTEDGETHRKQKKKPRPRHIMNYFQKDITVNIRGGSVILRWMQSPLSVHKHGTFYKNSLKPIRESACLTIDTRTSNSDSSVAASILEARAISLGFKNMDIAPQPKIMFSRGPLCRILMNARIAAYAGSQVGILKRLHNMRHRYEDPIDEFKILNGQIHRDIGPSSKEDHCTFCNMHRKHLWHIKQCPVIKAALAIPRQSPCDASGVCPVCGGFGSNTDNSRSKCSSKEQIQDNLKFARHNRGCDSCKGKLPENLWRPGAVSSPWLYHIRPGTLGVMHAVQNVGNAAIHEFDRPELANSLGPVALLTIGVLAEEVVKFQFSHNA